MRSPSMYVFTSLNPPSSGATTLQVLKGTVAVTIGKEHKVQVISDQVLSAKGTKRTVKNTTIEITEVRKTPLGCEIRYSLTGSDSDRPELELTDAKGNAFDCRSSSFSMGGPKAEVRLEFGPPQMAWMGRRAAPGEPAKLSCSWWESVEHYVPFEFHDLPLP